MINFVFFDLDGVVRIWNQEDDAAIERASDLPVNSIRDTAFVPDLLLPAISGQTTDDEWRAAVASRLRMLFPKSTADLAIHRWSAHFGMVNRDVMEVIEDLNPGIRIGLITNATSRLTYDLKLLGIEHHFGAIINSSEFGVPKPDEKIFRFALQHQGIGADQAFFVDDNDENILAAEAVGIRGHVFKDAALLRRTLVELELMGCDR